MNDFNEIHATYFDIILSQDFIDAYIAWADDNEYVYEETFLPDYFAMYLMAGF